MSENENSERPQTNIDDFSKIMKDFYKDILTSFPEYKEKLDSSTVEFLMGKNDGLDIFEYCRSVYPERFFDILYQNEDMFKINRKCVYLKYWQIFVLFHTSVRA